MIDRRGFFASLAALFAWPFLPKEKEPVFPSGWECEFPIAESLDFEHFPPAVWEKAAYADEKYSCIASYRWTGDSDVQIEYIKVTGFDELHKPTLLFDFGKKEAKWHVPYIYITPYPDYPDGDYMKVDFNETT